VWASSGDRIVTVDTPGQEARVCSLIDGSPRHERALAITDKMAGIPQLSTDGKWLVWGSRTQSALSLWDLQGPPDAVHSVFPVPDVTTLFNAIHHNGTWLATSTGSRVILRPLTRPFPVDLGRNRFSWDTMAFSPDSRYLVGAHRVWQLDPTAGPGRELEYAGFAIHPDGRCIARCLGALVELQCSAADTSRTLLDEGVVRDALAFDHSGRRLAMATHSWIDSPAQQQLQVVDVETGEVRSFALIENPEPRSETEGGVMGLSFAPDGSLFTAGWGGVRRWDLEDGSSDWVHEVDFARLSLSRNGRWLLIGGGEGCSDTLDSFDELLLLDLVEGTRLPMTAHGAELRSLALDSSGRIIATGGQDGVVRVGPATGEPPHLLFGHQHPVFSVAISPDGRWVASEANDGIRLWPMPDLDEPPMHTLPHDQLLARLDDLTNLRAAKDQGSATGWKLEAGPFPGWQDQPTW
jgi:WD40 repeat protein